VNHIETRCLHIHHPVVGDARSGIGASLGLQIEHRVGISHLNHQGGLGSGGVGVPVVVIPAGHQGEVGHRLMGRSEIERGLNPQLQTLLGCSSQAGLESP